MTVAELIAHLQTMPQDRQIVAMPDNRPDDESVHIIKPQPLIWLKPMNNLKAAIRFDTRGLFDGGEVVITYL